MSNLEIIGQILVVYLREYASAKAGDASLVVRDPKLLTIAGRAFVCGVLYYPKYTDDWHHGQRVRIALDNIRYYIEIPTVEDYIETDPKMKKKAGRSE